MKQAKPTRKAAKTATKKAREEKVVKPAPKHLDEADRKTVARLLLKHLLVAVERLEESVYNDVPDKLWDKYHDGEAALKEFNADSIKHLVKTAVHLEYGVR